MGDKAVTLSQSEFRGRPLKIVKFEMGGESGWITKN